MSGIATAVVAGGVLTYLGSQSQASSATQAAQTQAGATQAGIDEARRQFDAIQKLFGPYIQMGTGALGAQGALLGLSGPEAQQAAIAALEKSPQFKSMVEQGEAGILSGASATGGLRGGNVQAAMAQFRPRVLSSLIESQFSKLGGLSSLGQASAAGQAAGGLQTGQNIGTLLGQQGAALAGGILGQGQAQAQLYSGLGSTVGNLGMLKALGVF